MAIYIQSIYSFRLRQWPKITIKPAIKWAKGANGLMYGSDRGSSYDVYESEITIIDEKSEVQELCAVLDSYRESMTITYTDTTIFSPEVDHSVTLTCAVIDYGKVEQVFFNSSTPVQAITLRLRLLSPTFIGTTASLSTLRLQEQFTAASDFGVSRAFTESGANKYTDSKADPGVFIGEFSQKTSEAKAILAYLRTTARGAAFTLPTFAGVTYPFGYNRGTGPFTVVADSYSIERKNLNRWSIKIQFREAE